VRIKKKPNADINRELLKLPLEKINKPNLAKISTRREPPQNAFLRKAILGPKPETLLNILRGRSQLQSDTINRRRNNFTRTSRCSPQMTSLATPRTQLKLSIHDPVPLKNQKKLLPLVPCIKSRSPFSPPCPDLVKASDTLKIHFSPLNTKRQSN
jgi:hypothetical protein